jgi:hypothetical protein
MTNCENNCSFRNRKWLGSINSSREWELGEEKVLSTAGVVLKGKRSIDSRGSIDSKSLIGSKGIIDNGIAHNLFVIYQCCPPSFLLPRRHSFLNPRRLGRRNVSFP